MRFNFKRATVGEIIASLKRVVRGEKIKAEEKALWEIAKAASGSFRDATKLLEQASLMQKEVTAETVLKILGQLEGFRPIELLKMLARREAKGAIEWLGLATQAGVDLKILLESLIEDLRKMLLLSVGVVEENEQGFERLMTTEEIKRLISLLMAAAKEGGTAFVPQLPLEMAIIEWCGEKAGGEGKVEKVEQVEKVGKAPKEEVALGGKTAENKEEGEKVGFLEIEKKWNQVLVGLRAINHSVEALLRSCRPAEISGNLLTIEVFYKFHKERLETAAYREMVEKAFFDLLGRPLRLRWVLREKKKEGKEENISGNQIGDDIIRAAEEIFGGKVD
jgi:DNA polymerase-3 subunit gamma/tau